MTFDRVDHITVERKVDSNQLNSIRPGGAGQPETERSATCATSSSRGEVIKDPNGQGSIERSPLVSTHTSSGQRRPVHAPCDDTNAATIELVLGHKHGGLTDEDATPGQDEASEVLDQPSHTIHSFYKLPTRPYHRPVPSDRASANYNPVLLASGSQKSLNFSNFLPHSGNREAIRHAKRIAVAGPGLRLGLVCFHGGSGLGKSHLLEAIDVLALSPRVVLTSVADLQAEVKHATRLRQRAELRRWLSQVGLLLVDDILDWGNQETQLAITLALDTVEQWGGVVALAGREPPEAVSSLPSPLSSRLNAGLVVELFPPSFDERLRLMNDWFGATPAEPQALELLGRTYPNDLRRMRAAVFIALAMREVSRSKVVDTECVRRSLTQLDGVWSERRVDMAPGERQPDAPVLDSAPAADLSGAAAVPSSAVATAADLSEPPSGVVPPVEADKGGLNTPYEVRSVQRLKAMIAAAATPKKQMMADMALAARLRKMRREGGDKVQVRRLKRALSLLRGGNQSEALKWL